jgi:hypothetical protein
MSFTFCIDNRKTQIQSLVTFEDGDLLYCNPGVDFCSGRLFDLIELPSALDTNAFFKNIYNVDKIPSFGSNQYGLIRLAGFKYYLYETQQLKYNDSFIIEHAADYDGKRYCETWITYYPTAAYSPSFISGDDLLVHSDGCQIKPVVKGDLIQSITLPAAASAYHDMFASDYNCGDMKLHQVDGKGFILWKFNFVIIYEWNGTSYDEVGFFELGSVVQGAVIRYNTTTAKYEGLISSSDDLIYITRADADSNWEIETTYSSWGGVNGIPHFKTAYGDQFWMFSQYRVPSRYTFSTRALEYYYGINGDWVVWPADTYVYGDNYSSGYGIGEGWWSVLGGSPYHAIHTARMDSTEPGTWRTGSVYTDEDGNLWLAADRSWVYWVGGSLGTTVQTSEKQLLNYEMLNGYTWEGGRNLIQPYKYNGYIWDKYLVGFSSINPSQSAGVWYCHKTTEIIRLYDATTEHVPYNKVYSPVWPAPNYIVNGLDGTLKVLEMKASYFDEVSPVVGLFLCTTQTAITVTTNFEIPVPPANTDYKFLLSPDNITWYKWSGATWVTESDVINNGNTRTEFITGCVANFSFPADCYTAYIKIAMFSTDADTTPYFNWDECKLYLTTISTANSCFLADDSKLLIEHISPTETKFTSLMGPNVIIAAQVNILAPPYNVDYED